MEAQLEDQLEEASVHLDATQDLLGWYSPVSQLSSQKHFPIVLSSQASL